MPPYLTYFFCLRVMCLWVSACVCLWVSACMWVCVCMPKEVRRGCWITVASWNYRWFVNSDMGAETKLGSFGRAIMFLHAWATFFSSSHPFEVEPQYTAKDIFDLLWSGVLGVCSHSQLLPFLTANYSSVILWKTLDKPLEPSSFMYKLWRTVAW